MQKAALSYMKTSVETTSKGELLLLLYEAAIKFLRQAKERMEAKDYAQKGILISRALDIIAELQNSLNVQKGGELADNLFKLYFFCNTRLLRANMNMDTKIVDEVIKVLSGLRDAYRQIIKQNPENLAESAAKLAEEMSESKAEKKRAANVVKMPAPASGREAIDSSYNMKSSQATKQKPAAPLAASSPPGQLKKKVPPPIKKFALEPQELPAPPQLNPKPELNEVSQIPLRKPAAKGLAVYANASKNQPKA